MILHELTNYQTHFEEFTLEQEEIRGIVETEDHLSFERTEPIHIISNLNFNDMWKMRDVNDRKYDSNSFRNALE